MKITKNMKISIAVAAILIIIALVLILFPARKEIHLSGQLVYWPTKTPSFYIGEHEIMPNDARGITRDVLFSYVNKTVDVVGIITTIKVGVTGPNCDRIQIGCERDFEVIVPERIDII